MVQLYLFLQGPNPRRQEDALQASLHYQTSRANREPVRIRNPQEDRETVRRGHQYVDRPVGELGLHLPLGRVKLPAGQCRRAHRRLA